MIKKSLFAVLCTLGLAACSGPIHPPLQPVAQVDLPRFMGDWYVIANIPTFIEKGAHNAVESYALNPDGTIATTFRFNKGSFDGPEKVYTPKAWVREGTGNAVWGMQFVWPIKADYQITYVDPTYQHTIISREKRDYVWLMARTPTIPAADYDRLVALIAAQGYDISQLQRVPQQGQD